jgi:hypothetical protein
MKPVFADTFTGPVDEKDLRLRESVVLESLLSLRRDD